MQFTRKDESILVCALRVAAERFAEDAAMTEEPRLRQQFQSQFERAVELADQIEAEGIA